MRTDCPCRGTGIDRRMIHREGQRQWEESPCGICKPEEKKQWRARKDAEEKEAKRR